MVLNNYKPSVGLPEGLYHQETPADEYDVNFCFSPVPPVLESEGVKLVPLAPSLHAKPLLALLTRYPTVYDYLPYPRPQTDSQFLTFLETLRRDPNTLLFAIFDQSLILPSSDATSDSDNSLSPQRIAGLIGLLKSQEVNRLTEIGHISIPPPFQRSHIATHSCGLLLKYAFDTLGLRRVQWFANELNLPSVNAALRLGLSHEGLLKWDRVLAPPSIMARALPASVKGEEREKEEKRGGGRHSAVLAESWEEWRESGREKLKGLMERKVEKRGLETIKF